jgi:hypothetical protein
MKKLLNEIESLLLKKNLSTNEKSAFPEFIEPELFPLLKELFQYTKTELEENSKMIIPLFKDIIAMEKSTGAMGFYQMLENSNISFSEELFLYGINTEPYYNNNDEVFVRYLTVASKGTDMAIATKALVEKIGNGHKFQFYTVFNEMMKLRWELKNPICIEKVSTLIIRVIETSKFYQTQRKAITAAIFFDLKEALPVIKKIFEEERQGLAKLLDVQENKSSKYRDISSKSINLAALAEAITFLSQ